MKHGPQFGEGEFKKVYEHATDPEKVYAELKESISNENIKGGFYLQKIFHMLFPDNVPDVHLAGNEGCDKPDADTVSYIVSKKLETSEVHKEEALTAIQFFADPNSVDEDKIEAYEKNDLEIKRNPAVQEFKRKAEEAGIDIDGGGQNFSLKNGVVQYVEVNPAFQTRPPSLGGGMSKIRFNPHELLNAIEKLPDEQREKAMLYYTRLIDLSFNTKTSPK